MPQTFEQLETEANHHAREWRIAASERDILKRQNERLLEKEESYRLALAYLSRDERVPEGLRAIAEEVLKLGQGE